MNAKAIAFWIGVALAAPAQAQIAVSHSGSESNAGALSGSNSGSASSVVINNPAIPANTTNRITDDVNYHGRYDVRGVPNVIVPNILPSAVCHGTSSAGVSVLGLGLGGGSSWQDADCQLRETARLFHAMGMTADSVAIMCASAFAKTAPSCKPYLPAPKAEADMGTKVGEPGQPGGGDRTRADNEFCNRPEVREDRALSERNGCVVAAVAVRATSRK